MKYWSQHRWTHKGAEYVVAARETGRRVAVVSNNSPEAVAAYLKREHLTDYVAKVIGRYPAMPAKYLKPSSA